MSEEMRQPAKTGHMVVALIVLGIGIQLLLSNLGIIPSRNLWHFWPLALVIGGMVNVLQPGSGFHKAVGTFVLVLGLLLLASNFGFLPFRAWDLWPLLLIFWGGMLLFRTMRGGAVAVFGSRKTLLTDADQVSIFGGTKRVVTGDFQGGNITAVFGGSELDLRQAGMEGDIATIEVNVMFGGAEIKAPQNWDVILRGIGIFGGFNEDTMHPNPGPGVKRLIVRGTAIFGGVHVKN